ncbi:DUF4913 domain-containing protein [Arthrobacter sp. Soil736]|uniref:DUF4913 domain-containing protein n=1 Tax=Arthrobacter sp. Soil736 TaxID=1736395 RepID=UPI001F12072B|nr:DUF4913 domain-containing protein [Arthrobacter sp. Soil736]
MKDQPETEIPSPPEKDLPDTALEQAPARSEEDGEEVEDFQLTAGEVVALVGDRAEKMTVSTFRTLVTHGDAPKPLNWGRTPLWSFRAIEDWISEMFASGVLTAASPEPEAAGPQAAPATGDASPQDEPEPEAELVFGSTAQWVEEYLVPMYRREISANGSTTTWCPEWWRHAEAIIRFEALWRAWEHLRLDGKTGMSVFMKDHMDHHLPILLDGKGPFDGCSVDRGHATAPDGIKAFRLLSPPPELFPDVRPSVNDTEE